MEKLILALVFAAKRLRRYFQAHPVATTHRSERTDIGGFSHEKPETELSSPRAKSNSPEPGSYSRNRIVNVDVGAQALSLHQPGRMESRPTAFLNSQPRTNEANNEPTCGTTHCQLEWVVRKPRS
ncbi:hypothetical protein Tco_0746591 [Tanacetum coccineum]